MLDGHNRFSLTIEPTSTVFIAPPDITGLRMWRGHTEDGIEVTVLVASVCSGIANQPEFDVALDAALERITRH
jgi:hypothetical protein